MKTKTKYMSKQKDFKEESKWLKPLSWLMVCAFLMGSVYLVNLNAKFFQTSLFPNLTHEPFDGTMSPIQDSPDWVKLNGEEWDYSYDQLAGKMIALPKYEPSKLATSVANLEWGDPEDDMIRNAKITYPVPYMGSYELDGLENSGSHLAIDIKIPKGTPVYAIANGIADKVSLQSSGFGKHVVLRHKNFPTLEDENATETLYSSYSHLGDVTITEGQIIKKGQQIGVSGESGTATTPHLHFQIDNDLAPWHPFWPFTYQESADAGYSFFEAINAGLGRARGLANTVNPMKYVQKYADYDLTHVPEVVVPEVVIPEVVVPEVVVPEVVVPEVVVPEVVVPEVVVPEVVVPEVVVPEKPAAPKYEFVHDSEFQVGVPEKINLKITYAEGYPLKYYDLVLIQALSGEVEFGKKTFSAMDFKNGGFEFYITPSSSKKIQLQAILEGQVLATSIPLAPQTFKDVSDANKYYTAIRYLQNKGIITGYPDGTFRPYETVTRVEAIKMILAGIQKNLEENYDIPFPDVSTNAWYSNYVKTAYKDGIISGYPDKTFKPDNEVNKAEFFKILLLAMEVDLDPEVLESPYSDVSEEDWFAPYVQFVKEKNLLDALEDIFGPEKDMTRGEVAEAMFRVMILSQTSADKFSASLVDGILM